MNKLTSARRTFLVGGMIFFATYPALSKPKAADPRLRGVRSVFVKGNNEAAERAREELMKGGCLRLVSNPELADAVMEIIADASSQGGAFGSLGGRNWTASATLTLKTGDLVWSKSTRQTDAPFHGGGNTAGKLLVKYLSKDVGCK